MKKGPSEIERKDLEPLTEIGIADLRRQDAIYFLGMMAARGLELFGQVTLMISGDDKVAMANPVHVYLDVGAFISDQELPTHPPFRWVRPVLGQGKPQYVAWKEGVLWEIEFEEPYESQQDQSCDPHQGTSGMPEGEAG